MLWVATLPPFSTEHLLPAACDLAWLQTHEEAGLLFKKRKLTPREAKRLAQSHTAHWQLSQMLAEGGWEESGGSLT